MKRKGLPKKNKSNFLFDVINDIKSSKRGDLLDQQEKTVSNYMMLKFLSMDNSSNLMVSDIMNQYQGILSPKQMYKLLIDIIPKKKSFDKYLSNKTNYSENVDFISKYFMISKREAQGYINEKGEEWAIEIKSKFGGKQGV